MSKAIQIKVLLAILAVLLVIAGLIKRGGPTIQVSQEDRQLQQKLAKKVQPPEKRYLVP